MLTPMKLLFQRGWIAGLLLATFSLSAADTLIWRTKEDRVTADIQSAGLIPVLEGVAKLTGWHVFLESNITQNVSVKFKDLPSGDALRFMLGDLNYAFVPQTNGSPRLFVFRTTRANATQAIQPGDLAPGKKLAVRKIPNELVVRLKPGASIDELAKKLGAKVIGRMEGLDTYRLQFPDEAAADAALEKLKTNGDVLNVEYNYVFDPPTAPQLLAGTPVGPVSLTLNSTTEGDPCAPIIGLIDTSIQTLGSGLDKFVSKQISVAGEVTVNKTVPTHATGMLQTLATAIAKVTGSNTTARVLAVDVYGASETTTSWNVALGVQAAVNNGANVLNLSLGSENQSAVLDDIIQQAVAKGILVFAAAGNQPVKTATYPAASSGVIAVTALQGNQLAPYANSGSFVDLALPGASVIYFGNQAYVDQGTSVATAYATGVAAGTKGQNCWPWAQIHSAMQKKFPVPQQ